MSESGKPRPRKKRKASRPPGKRAAGPPRSSSRSPSRPPGPKGPKKQSPAAAGSRSAGSDRRPAAPEKPRPPRPSVSAWAIAGPGRGAPEADLAIIGCGAAGMAAAVFAAEAAPGLKIVVLESARQPGAKILVSGGGRCNVTNEAVTPADFCGGSDKIIRNVLRAFDEQRTLEWMRSIGVELKLEPTGKYFPVTDSAATVLQALLERMRQLKVELRTGVKVNRLVPSGERFEIYAGREEPELRTSHVVMATGGLALPKSGSDGAGLRWMKAVGHTLIETTPALAPLRVSAGPWGQGPPESLKGLTIEARLALSNERGKKIAEATGSLLFTHFGLSGPAAMNFSRHLARFRLEHPADAGTVGLGLPQFRSPEQSDAWLREQSNAHPRREVRTVLGELMPSRVAHVLASSGQPIGQLTREQRLELARNLVAAPLQVDGDRGYAFAETTAGGVDLREIDPASMASRKLPGLYLCGEILDVDGRIGGFNFQWAWATGYLAGRAAARSLRDSAADESGVSG